MPDLATLDEHNAEFVEDLTRFSEKLATEQEIKRRYRLSKAAWDELGKNDALFDAVAERRIQRQRNGACKRERAQVIAEGAPDVVGEIMNNPVMPPGVRIEAAKVVNKIATEEPAGGTKTGEVFNIRIVLSSDTVIEKSIPMSELPAARRARGEKGYEDWGGPLIEHEPRKDDDGEPV